MVNYREERNIETKYFDNGQIHYQHYYLDKVFDVSAEELVHGFKPITDRSVDREDGPAFIRYFENGIIDTELWISNNVKYKELNYNHINGNLQVEIYYENEEEHRIDKPAVSIYYTNGNIKWEKYSINGKRHRLDGPAIICYYENGEIEKEEYWIDGNKYYDLLQYMIAIENLK